MTGVQKVERPQQDRSTSRTDAVQDTVTLSRDARTAEGNALEQARAQRQEEAAKARAVAKYEAEQKAAAPDVAAETTEQIRAVAAYKANLKTIQAADEVSGVVVELGKKA